MTQPIEVVPYPPDQDVVDDLEAVLRGEIQGPHLARTLRRARYEIQLLRQTIKRGY